MNPNDTLKAFGIVAGIIASPAVILASIKMMIFFGRMEKTVEDLGTQLAAFTVESQKHRERTESRLADLEAERRVEDRGRAARSRA